MTPSLPALATLRDAVSRRTLRLATGLTLLTYIAAHLLTHALGLVSLPLAERGLALGVAVWYSLPGSLLLYGAAGVHFALALDAIYQRRTLRMPPLELVRIWLGLAIPLLLIGHVIHTRGAWELYEASPRYARIVASLWLGDGEGRQLAMLVPGWLHGCLGVHFAFGRRAWYARLQLPLFALALLVPVLGGLGFLAMGKELAAAAALHPASIADEELPLPAKAALGNLRDQVLWLYFGAIGLVFAARALRAFVERQRQVLVAIAYPQRRVSVPRGWSVLEASRANGLPHVSMCGGRARCTTCRVRITAGAEHCPPPEDAERAALERIRAPHDLRLACQLRPLGDIGVQPLIAPPGAAPAASTAGATEGEFALVAVVWRNHAEFARAHLPQDVVYAAQAFAETAAGTLRSAGATIAESRADFVLALFGGPGAALPPACRDAIAAAQHAAEALRRFGTHHAAAFGAAPDCVVLVHAGRATVAPLAGSSQLLVAGPALAALRSMHAAPGERLVVSDAARASAAG